MNVGQPESLRLIAAAATGESGIQSVWVELFDGNAITVRVETDGGLRTIEVPWTRYSY